jgi:hypothetical protein
MSYILIFTDVWTEWVANTEKGREEMKEMKREGEEWR